MNAPVNLQDPFDGLSIGAGGDPILEEIIIPNRNTSTYLSTDLIGVADPAIREVDNTGFSDIPQIEKYENSSGKVKRGLYDHRQDIAMSLITLDVGVLRQIVDDHANPSSVNLGQEYFKDAAGDVTYIPENDWNGVVYVQFPLESEAQRSSDNIVRASPTINLSTGHNYSNDGTGSVYDARVWPPGTRTQVAGGSGDFMQSSQGGYYYRNDGGWGTALYNGTSSYGSYLSSFKYNFSAAGTQPVHPALQVINGEYVPSPTFATDPGFTLVTNVPLYVIDHYNADGVAHTDDAQKIEHSHYTDTNGSTYDEPPAALYADTITLLSPEWRPNSPSNLNTGHRYYSAESDKWNRDVDYTNLEVSAALVTGITPTIPKGTAMYPSDGAGSGGAINLPRFLEYWTGQRVTIRSSLVALFESEVHTEPYHDYFNHFYTPPDRDWGFNENFDNGIYPPGTPNVRAFRRTRFEDITAAEYTTGTTL